MKRKAFTILEILVVISVIAILAAISLPRFKGLQDEAKIAKTRAELNTLKVAVLAKTMRNNGLVPPTWTEVINDSPNTISSTVPDGYRSGNLMYQLVVSLNQRFFAIVACAPAGVCCTTINDSGVVANTCGNVWVSNGPVGKSWS